MESNFEFQTSFDSKLSKAAYNIQSYENAKSKKINFSFIKNEPEELKTKSLEQVINKLKGFSTINNNIA